MAELQLLKYQIKMAQDLTLQLVNELDDKFWKLTPPGLKSNINWQVGHIAVSLYHNSLVGTNGADAALKNLIPLFDLINMYKTGTSPEENLQKKPDKEELLIALRIIFRQVEVNLNSLPEDELEEVVKDGQPSAKTKREMLIWCSHHQMWHNGLISMLKRILIGKGY